MKLEDMLKETKETRDMLDDIREIDEVLNRSNLGYGFDEHKARKIIAKHNAKDAVILAHNNTPGMSAPLNTLPANVLYNNLVGIRNYLFMKRQAELAKAAEKEKYNHADT
ncbi:MAG: hypothetical protein IKJ65_12145 [Clostridia bacterium]|nr:hypothetical protein [Clostridia bacterium]